MKLKDLYSGSKIIENFKLVVIVVVLWLICGVFSVLQIDIMF